MNQLEELSPMERMIRQQLMDRGIRDPRVLDAMRAVPREQFMPRELRDKAYAEAERRADAVLKEVPDGEISLLVRAEARFAAGDLAGALDDYAALLRVPTAWSYLGSIMTEAPPAIPPGGPSTEEIAVGMRQLKACVAEPGCAEVLRLMIDDRLQAFGL